MYPPPPPPRPPPPLGPLSEALSTRIVRPSNLQASVRQGDHRAQTVRKKAKAANKPRPRRTGERLAARKFVLDIVHRINGVLGIGLLCVPHESKPTAAASVSILDNNLWGHESTSLVLDTLFLVPLTASAVSTRTARKRQLSREKAEPGQRAGQVRGNGMELTASSTAPNSSNFWRSVPSSVCHARPLLLARLANCPCFHMFP